MVVVIGNDLPPAVRGRMKLWFIEPKPNVFISGIKDSVAATVVKYLSKHCKAESGIIIFRSTSKAPGFEITSIGIPSKEVTDLFGLQLVVEKNKF